QHLAVEPRPVTALRPAVPASASLALTKALAKTPADRFGTASQFAAALQGTVPTASAWWRRRMALGIAALVTAASGAAWWLGSRPAAPPKSLVVLPFENFSGDPGVDYLCDGLASEIASDLVGVPRFNVVSHTTAVAYKGSKKSVPDIARELGVEAVLEGVIQKRGSLLHLEAQLVNGKSGFVSWTGKFERGTDDLIRLEQDVVRDVASVVTGHPAASLELARAPTGSPEAYDAYLQASRYLDLTDDPATPA